MTSIRELVQRPGIRLYDSTMINDFRRCPRYFYYRHILGWAMDYGKPSLAATYGICWSLAMDWLWVHPGDIEGAHKAFLEGWTGRGLEPYPVDSYRHRHPMTAKEMLYAYNDQRKWFLRNHCKVLAVEEPFVVPLDPSDDTLWYMGRLDKVIDHGGDVLIVDHKTTSSYAASGASPPFRWNFLESFIPNFQIEGYQYAGRMLYGKKFRGVWIDAALVHARVHDGFKFIPIEQEVSQLDAWLWNCRNQIDHIEAYIKQMDAEGTKYMAAFPKNDRACFDYNSPCSYLEPCRMWADPRGQPPPPGFVESRWSPFNHAGGDKT